MDIKFNCTGGPFGDCTCNYDVEVPEGTTVGEFIDYVVSDYSINSGNNWGFFSIIEFGQRTGYNLEYNRGKSFYELPWCSKAKDELLIVTSRDKKITKIKANGGWTNMSYDIYI